MTNIDLFTSYLMENNIPKELFPIELYFMQYRAESTVSSRNISDNKPTNIGVEVKPNYLLKIGYTGAVHTLPVGNLSLIINQEKLI